MKTGHYKKGLAVILSGMFAALFLALPAVAGEDVCGHVTLEWIQSQAPAASSMPETAKILLKQPRGEFCEVVLGFEGRLSPLYAGKDAVITGKMYSRGEAVSRKTITGLADVAARERALAKEKKAAAAEARKGFYKENTAGLDALVSMRFRPESGKSLYVITDPRCSHCKALMPELEAAAFEGRMGLDMIVYPALGKKSRDMAAHALCNGFDYMDYVGMAAPDSAAACEKADGLIEKTVDFMKTAGQTAVPVVIAADGSWMVEGNDINQIRSHLGLEPLEGAVGHAGACKDG